MTRKQQIIKDIKKFLSSISQNKNIELVLDYCDVNPFSKFYIQKVHFVKKWKDNYKTFIYWSKLDEEPKMVFNYLDIPKSNNDLYEFLNYQEIAKISTKYFLGINKEEDIKILTFLCLDKKIRTFLIDGSNLRVSPMYTGMKNLLYLIDVENHVEFFDKQKNYLEFDEQYFGILPIPEKIIRRISR